MIQRWFGPRGAIGRRRFFTDTVAAWLLGNLAFVAFFLAYTSTYRLADLGRVLDHRAQTLDAMNQTVGAPWTFLVLVLWSAQIWALAALSSKRLHDMGQGGWLAGLSLVPGVRILFWLVLCLWPAQREASVQAA